MTEPKNLVERDEAIKQARIAGATLAEIGVRFGLTRERVRQILRKVMSDEEFETFGGRQARKRRHADAVASAIHAVAAELDAEDAYVSRAEIIDRLMGHGVSKGVASRLAGRPEFILRRVLDKVPTRPRPARVWSVEDVLDALRAFAADEPTGFEEMSSTRYREWLVREREAGRSRPSIGTVMSHRLDGADHGWEAMVSRVGGTTAKTARSLNSGPKTYWTEERVLERVRTYLTTCRTQEHATMTNYTVFVSTQSDRWPSVSTVILRTGSWGEAKRRALGLSDRNVTLDA